jgi:hypothetical protein
MRETEYLLNNLRDIHIPEKADFWPLAIGWWFVIAVIFLIIIYISYKVYKVKRRKRLFDKFLSECGYGELSNEKIKTLDTKDLTSNISIFIKRLEIIKNKNVKDMYGEQWADYIIDKTRLKDVSSAAQGYLSQAMYMNKNFVDSRINLELIKILRKYLRNN